MVYKNDLKIEASQKVFPINHTECTFTQRPVKKEPLKSALITQSILKFALLLLRLSRSPVSFVEINQYSDLEEISLFREKHLVFFCLVSAGQAGLNTPVGSMVSPRLMAKKQRLNSNTCRFSLFSPEDTSTAFHSPLDLQFCGADDGGRGWPLP